MYRMMTNEKVAGAIASASTVTTRVAGTSAIVDFARAVVNSARRTLTRARVADVSPRLRCDTKVQVKPGLRPHRRGSAKPCTAVQFRF